MDTFLALTNRQSRYRSARYAILPVPYDGMVSHQTGARWGPRAIIRASAELEDFDPEYGREFVRCGIATLEPVETPTAGPEEVQEAIHSAAGRVVQDGKCLIGIGGDHSITSALVRAVRSRHRTLSVLQIDAHADLRNRYQGSPRSHACAMRRVADMGVRVQPVGLRTCSLEEHRFMKKHRITPVWAKETLEDPDWIMRTIDGLSDEVYVTLDIDAFDPAFAPGTGTPEPGGLDWYQVTDLLQAVAMQRSVVAADVVEVMPLPGTIQTEFLAARVIYKLIAHLEANR